MPPDPVPPVPPSLDAATASAQNAKTAFDSLADTIANRVGGAIDIIITKFTGATNAQGKMIDSSTNAGLAIDALSVGLLGASKAFDVFNESSKGMVGFHDQIMTLGGAGKLAASSLQALGSAGGFVAKAGGSLVGFVENMAKSADAALKLQNGYLAMMGTTGGLNAVFDEAGDGLQDLNSVMFKQNELISSIAGSTATSMGEVSGYFKLLGETIPNSTAKQIEATDSAGKSYNTLQGAMTLATGTARNVSAVVADMKVAWEAYGLSGDKALEFTSRMSELNNKFGINLEYTEGFVKKNAEAFHLIAQGGDNASESLNRLFTSFKSTGLSAKDSTEMIGHMTGQMAKLTMGQKAFLSAQSGGPGGLKGALQIENQLRSGDVEGVLKKAETAIKKQFGGKIYTQEEGAQSEYAAGQFTKQRAMLKSGAFGGLAQNDESATRILEAFKKGTSGVDALAAPSAGLDKALSKGESLQQTANTELSAIRRAIEHEQGIAANSSLNMVQKFLGTTQRTDRGKEGNERVLNMRQANRDSSERTAFVGSTISGQSKLDVNESRNANAIEVLKSLSNSLPAVIKPTFERMISGLNSGGHDTGKNQNIAELNGFKKQLQDQQEAAAKMALVSGKKMEPNNEDNRILAAVTKGMNVYASNDVNKGAAGSQAVNDSLASASTPNPQARGQAGHVPGQHPGQTQKQKMEVTFKAVCFKCNKPYEADTTTKNISGGTIQ